MEDDGINFSFPICTNVPPDIAESSTIIEEGPRICPLCNSIVRLYFINFHEQIQMCENTECEFPFGYEEVQYVRHKVDLDEDELSMSIKPSVTGTSVVSSIAWAEIEKITKVQEEDSQFDMRLETELNERDKHLEELQKKREAEKKLKKKVQNIRSLTHELVRNNDDMDIPQIQDEKLINKLMNLQDKLGCQLLKEGEMVKVKKKEPLIGLGELKIDIGETGDNVSSITIAITSQCSDAVNSKINAD